VHVSIAFRLSIGISRKPSAARFDGEGFWVSIAFRLSIGISLRRDFADMVGFQEVSIAFRLSIGISRTFGVVSLLRGCGRSQSPFGCL